jgi:hypothetical protein
VQDRVVSLDGMDASLADQDPMIRRTGDDRVVRHDDARAVAHPHEEPDKLARMNRVLR